MRMISNIIENINKEKSFKRNQIEILELKITLTNENYTNWVENYTNSLEGILKRCNENIKWFSYCEKQFDSFSKS